MQQYTVAVEPDVDIAVFDSGGDGPPVVVLHGLAGSAVEFFETAAELSDFRMILLEARAHGRSTRHPHDVSREAHVSDVVRLVESLGCGRVALVGQSMGGHTALLVAASRPDLVARLVLLEAGVGGEGAAGVGDFFRAWPVPFADETVARAHLGDGPLARAWIADLERRDGRLWPRFDAETMAATISAVDRPRWREWESVTAPTLVVYGESGMFTERQRTEFLARGHDVRRVDLVGGSHDAHLDAAEEWTEVLGDFLRLWTVSGAA
jgi:pimeloyl-ACP methyl ester carboxylesterase